MLGIFIAIQTAMPARRIKSDKLVQISAQAVTLFVALALHLGPAEQAQANPSRFRVNFVKVGAIYQVDPRAVQYGVGRVPIDPHQFGVIALVYRELENCAPGDPECNRWSLDWISASGEIFQLPVDANDLNPFVPYEFIPDQSVVKIPFPISFAHKTGRHLSLLGVGKTGDELEFKFTEPQAQYTYKFKMVQPSLATSPVRTRQDVTDLYLGNPPGSSRPANYNKLEPNGIVEKNNFIYFARDSKTGMDKDSGVVLRVDANNQSLAANRQVTDPDSTTAYYFKVMSDGKHEFNGPFAVNTLVHTTQTQPGHSVFYYEKINAVPNLRFQEEHTQVFAGPGVKLSRLSGLTSNTRIGPLYSSSWVSFKVEYRSGISSLIADKMMPVNKHHAFFPYAESLLNDLEQWLLAKQSQNTPIDAFFTNIRPYVDSSCNAALSTP
ncbi:MAG: hypothetical protein AB7N80_11575 [Bdellovibrionales bacterium]